MTSVSKQKTDWAAIVLGLSLMVFLLTAPGCSPKFDGSATDYVKAFGTPDMICSNVFFYSKDGYRTCRFDYNSIQSRSSFDSRNARSVILVYAEERDFKFDLDEYQRECQENSARRVGFFASTVFGGQIVRLVHIDAAGRVEKITRKNFNVLLM